VFASQSVQRLETTYHERTPAPRFWPPDEHYWRAHLHWKRMGY